MGRRTGVEVQGLTRQGSRRREAGGCGSEAAGPAWRWGSLAADHGQGDVVVWFTESRVHRLHGGGGRAQQAQQARHVETETDRDRRTCGNGSEMLSRARVGRRG